MNVERNHARRPIALLAWVILSLLMLLLAFRLSALETLHESLQKMAFRINPGQAATVSASSSATASAASAPSTADVADVASAPDIGPAFTAVYATLSLLLAALATLAGVKAGAFSWRRAGQFLLTGGILAWAVASAFHAQNRFVAVVGAADLAASLCAAWSLMVILHPRLLGDGGRRILFAAVLACVSINGFKAFEQYFVEFPDLAQYVHTNREDVLKSQGIENDPGQAQLFLSRIASGEVSGFALDSDVLASELIAGAALLALLIAAGAFWFSAKRPRATAPSAPANSEPLEYASKKLRRGSAARSPAEVQVPLEAIAFVAAALVFFLLLWMLALTGSKGGIAAAVLAALLAAGGFVFRDRIARHRRLLLASAATTAVLATASVIFYGIRHDALPTRSLLFRWHYWTASVPIIKKSPVLGVGLNNFGDYYLQYKRPSAPEDVTDPHNFFIRFATETGIPEACAVGLLILWMLQGAFRAASRKVSPLASEPAPAVPLFPVCIVSLAIAVIWVLLHALVVEPINEFTFAVTVIYAVLAWGVFLAAWLLLNLPGRSVAHRSDSAAPGPLGSDPLISSRAICMVLAVAALGMLLYDQVNLALVTGPVAMLFWMLLASADTGRVSISTSTGGAPAVSQRRSLALASAGIAICLLFAGAFFAAMFSFTLPLFSQTFPWDPTPPEIAYIRDVNAPDWPAASRELDAAIALAPMSIDLRLQRITLDRDELHRPVADEIRRVFALDRANAVLRVRLALPDSDLPPAERIAALREALDFDSQLETGEAKRLSAETLTTIHVKIAGLQAAADRP